MKVLREVVSVDPRHSFYVGRFSGDEDCKAKYWHFHPEYEIVFIKKGVGTREIGDHTSRYENGELILLGPNIPHLAYKIDPLPANYEIVIQFSQDLVDRMLEFAEMSPVKLLLQHAKEGMVFGDEAKSKISGYIDDILAQNGQRVYCLFRLLNDLAVSQDFSGLKLRPLQISRPNADVDRLEKIFAFVSKNYKESISIEELASKIGLTTNSLCRFFKQITGNTMVSFIHQYRISHAKEMLMESSASIGEIAYQSGFTDVGFFNRKFKETAGMTPSAYRKKFKRLNISDHLLQ